MKKTEILRINITSSRILQNNGKTKTQTQISGFQVQYFFYYYNLLSLQVGFNISLKHFYAYPVYPGLSKSELREV